MLFSLVKGLVLAGLVVIAGVTMVTTTKLAGGGSWGMALGCLATIVVLAVLAVVAFQVLEAWTLGT